jgi:NitT/TauT family transport system substrate-binding protein
MKAYLRGVRDYVSALKDSKIAGAHADEIIDIISRYSSIKDKNTLKMITAHYVDPNGEIGTESLKADWAYFKQEKLINGSIGVDQIVDDQWIKAAVAQLGVYKN